MIPGMLNSNALAAARGGATDCARAPAAPTETDTTTIDQIRMTLLGCEQLRAARRRPRADAPSCPLPPAATGHQLLPPATSTSTQLPACSSEFPLPVSRLPVLQSPATATRPSNGTSVDTAGFLPPSTDAHSRAESARITSTDSAKNA